MPVLPDSDQSDCDSDVEMTETSADELQICRDDSDTDNDNNHAESDSDHGDHGDHGDSDSESESESDSDSGSGMLKCFVHCKKVLQEDRRIFGGTHSHFLTRNPYIPEQCYKDMNGYASCTCDVQEMNARIVSEEQYNKVRYRDIISPRQNDTPDMSSDIFQSRAVFTLIVAHPLAMRLMSEFWSDPNVLFQYQTHGSGASNMSNRLSHIEGLYTRVMPDKILGSWDSNCYAHPIHAYGIRMFTRDSKRLTSVSIASKAFGTLPGVDTLHPDMEVSTDHLTVTEALAARIAAQCRKVSDLFEDEYGL